MTVHYHRSFERQYKALNKKMRERVRRRIALCMHDTFHATLNNHALRGKYDGCRSINTSDIRAVYRVQTPDVFLFITVGSHSQLYG